MKKILLTFLFLYSLQTSAQGRYCTSFNDYLEDNWIEVPTLTINRHSKSAPKPNEAIDYSFTSNDETTDTHLDEKAVFVQCNDSLFINLREFSMGLEFFTNHYALAYPLTNNKIVFISPKPKEYKSVHYLVVGPIPIPLKFKSTSKPANCYLIDDISLGGYSPVKLIGDESITKVLNGHDDLIDEYFAEKKKKIRETPSHIMPLLRKAKMIP